MAVRRRRRTGVWRSAAALLVLVVAGAGCGSGDGADDRARPGPDRPPPLVHVALGDSFSSGEGAPPYDAVPEPCRRAAEAWPRRLDAAHRSIASVDLRACAGARTEHLVERWRNRDLDPQIPVEPDPEVTLVTLTIGGNDIGFGDVVAACVLLTCAPAPGSDELEARLGELRTELVERVHPALAGAFPNARIVHVGYPHLAPAPGPRAVDCPWLSRDDRVRARGLVDALNATIEGAAEQSGTAQHLDVADAFAGHELCTRDPWVNAVSFGPGAAHPNGAGQRALEATVAAALDLDGS